MDLITTINAVVVTLGIPTIVGTLIFIGGKLKTLDNIEDDIRSNIRPDLKDVRERFFKFDPEKKLVAKVDTVHGQE